MLCGPLQLANGGIFVLTSVTKTLYVSFYLHAFQACHACQSATHSPELESTSALTWPQTLWRLDPLGLKCVAVAAVPGVA